MQNPFVELMLILIVSAIVIVIAVSAEKPKTCEDRGGKMVEVDCRRRLECGGSQHAMFQCSVIKRCDQICEGAHD